MSLDQHTTTRGELLKRTRGIDYLLELNRQHSELFCSPAEQAARRLNRSLHPTEIMAAKCMDGRLNLSVITKTALGIIQPLRNVGGRFDLGWPYFKEFVAEWHEYSIRIGRGCLFFVTDHFSKGEPHRGCRGFGYDHQAALAHSRGLKAQFDEDFGIGSAFYTAHITIETDLDALTLHGEHGESVDLAEAKFSSDDEICSMLGELYPSMSERMRLDFFPLVKGNIQHIAEIRDENRPLEDADHREWVLAVGRGYDWLHKSNTAFIVGPFNPNLSDPIETAARLLLDNLATGRINGDHKIVLMTSAPFRTVTGYDPKTAARKSRWLTSFALETIKNRVPELAPYLSVLTTTVDINTRKLEVLERLESVAT